MDKKLMHRVSVFRYMYGDSVTMCIYSIMGEKLLVTNLMAKPDITVLIGSVRGLATFETAWEYDSYGKLVRMTYPGDERVTYHYNAAGDLDRVYRGKEDAGRDYVSYIGYDRFGDRVRVAYGNGTDMRYSYNARTRRLTTTSSHLNGVARASRGYLYDNVGSVYRISGSSPVSYSYYYDYDDLNRLVSCTQRYGSGNAVATDTLAMAYDDLWRVTSKSQRLAQKGLMFQGTLNTGYDMDYTYGTTSGAHYQLKDVAEASYRTTATPTSADHILSTHSYSYDPNGNLAHESVARRRIDDSTTRQISERKLLWDGLNRLRAISEDGYVSLYWYDAGGNRTVKEHGGGEAVWVNSAPAGQRTDTVACTIYPSPYISVTGDRWTKHYYVGSERIASRTGTLSGGFASLNIGDSNSAGNGLEITIDYGAMCSAEEDTIDSIYSHFGVPYEALHTNARDGGWHLYLPITRSGGTVGGEDASDTAGTAQDRSHPQLDGDSKVYFYHRDHLGSTMSVTDSLGATVQLVEYTPWGEVFVERRFGSSGYESPYLFNGKELDEETGLYYYGARYYDPKMSVWYSTDPMQMDYPWVTTYCHTMNNPNLFIDKEGRYILFIGGLRLTKGNADQIPLFGGFKIHSTDVYHYWSSDNNTFGRKVNIADYYQKVYNDYNVGFTSGSSHWNSTAFDRYMQGKDKAKLFHKMVMSGKIKLSEGEPIRIISHSQGAAHAIGFANQLMSYKNSKGESLYTIDYMEYITPHQPTDLVHPSGPIGIQYSHPSDAIASDSPSWLPNGGTSFGRIINITQFYGDDIMGGNNQPKAEGPIGNMGGHKVTDNDEYIKKGQR